MKIHLSETLPIKTQTKLLPSDVFYLYIIYLSFTIYTPMKYQVSFGAKTWYLHMWNNMLSSHVKISPSLWLQKMKTKIIAPFTTKNLKWNGLVVHWCLYNIKNRTLHGLLEIRNLSSCVETYCTSNKRSERVKYFFNTKREISYLCAAM